MYLKSIEIQGFKSFANKITFEFHNGITGIVGPNGSGKSNVSDAVRWVLGEQSAKQLRGGSMQDVIFAGTELRKPQGFAYVAITLENSDRALAIDYDEVKVSRRLYRSGESEYQINGSPCRLRDINEMFMDTGIGQDGYSIIGQGQVEQILSGKADDRRELFDEAAGITKFRKRKALAEKKLENERANMLRIGDILSELERQVGPLKKQSEAAQEYLRLREEQKRYDLNLFLLESDSCRSELADLENKEEILQGDADEAEARQAELRTQYEDLEKAISRLSGTRYPRPPRSPEVLPDRSTSTANRSTRSGPTRSTSRPGSRPSTRTGRYGRRNSPSSRKAEKRPTPRRRKRKKRPRRQSGSWFPRMKRSWSWTRRSRI